MSDNLHCSPYNQQKYGIKDGTCYSLQDLQTIATEYNKLNPKNKIDTDLSKKELHSALESAFRKVCSNEFCWADNKLIGSSSIKPKVKDMFRPKKPLEWYENKRTWLNTYDILFVMEQYERLYKDFLFLGVFPMDFAKNDYSGQCIGDMLCSFDINKDIIGQNKKRFAFVLNLDYHDEPGSHWVSVYCNLDYRKKNFGIYYYDSVANEPTSEVEAFMHKVQEQVTKYMLPRVSKRFQVKYNKIQKQFKDTECGMFSIIFLTQCLKHITFDFICKHMRTDDEINKLRDVVYTTKQMA